MIQFVGSGLLIWSFALIFSFFGVILISHFTRPELKPPGKLGSTLGFFAGMSIFLGTWRLLAVLFQSARLGFYGTTLLFLAVLVEHKKHVFEFMRGARQKWKSAVLCGLWIIFCQFFCGAFWSRDFYSNPYSTMGSGHSPRYANIALHILDSDHIPSLGQNYGQSMLAMVPSYMAHLRSPLIGLDIWLGLSVAILGILTYSIFRWMKLSAWMSIIGSAVVMLGNTAFTKKHIYILDSGSPFLVTGYTDTVFCLGSFVAFFYIVLQPSLHASFRARVLHAFTVFCFGLSWTMSAPQNLIVGTGVIACLGLLPRLRLFRKRGLMKSSERTRNTSQFSFVFVFLLTAMVSGVFLGGMFSSQKFRDDVKIPGLQTVSKQGGQAVSYLPTVPFVVGTYFGWEAGWLKTGVAGQVTAGEGSAFQQLIVRLGQAVKLIFYPLAGIFSLGLCVFWRKLRLPMEIQPIIGSLWTITTLSLLAGFLLSFPFSVFGSKWELSRFSTTGFYLGLISLILGSCYLFERLSKKVGYCVLLIILLGATYGPVHSISELMRHEFRNFSVLRQKYRSLADYNEIRS